MTAFRRARYAAMRCLLRTIGRASDGVRMVFDHGLTSGTMLDYVYRNRAAGRYLIGPLLDRIFLSHPAWRVIRVRKANLERLLREAIAVQEQLGRNPAILDVASGPARYLLDVLAGGASAGTRAVCCDLDDRALDLGRRGAAERGLAGRVRFVKGDALSAEFLAGLQAAPNIAVTSGFYDWITDDEVVRRSMALLHDRLPGGGCLVFTNQSGHVDLEMVEEVFPDFRGRPLRMVTRPGERVNGWAEAAGFAILRTARDEAGHYSVTLAQKPSRR